MLLAGCFSGYESDTPARDNLRVRRGAFRGDVVLTGELRAGRGDDLVVPRLPQWQTSIKWMTTDGAEVKQGERVVELDNSAFASNLDAKRQTVAQAQQELQQKDAEWYADTLRKMIEAEKKRVEYDKAKMEAAVPKEVTSARDFQDKQTKFQRAEVELAKAMDLLKSQRISVASDRENLLIKLHTAERELKIAEDALDQLILRAPKGGIVVIRDHPWEGRRLQEGDGVWVGFPLAQIPELSSLRVEADLADVDDGKIGAGMPATVILDAYPSVTFPARVTSISAVAQESSRQSLRRIFAVLVALDKLDAARMRPGLSARVVVHALGNPDALLVPRAALDFSSQQPRARLAGGKLVNVDLGPCNAQECIVKSGLKEGDALGRS
ncbi:MAG: HlyD family efflux transporter periplasmic adaptor subunit [Acidobacteriota bacterium]